MSLAFIPLSMFKKGWNQLKEDANKLQPKYRKFGQKFLAYYKKTWIDGNYPRESWNFFLFPGKNIFRFNYFLDNPCLQMLHVYLHEISIANITFELPSGYLKNVTKI